MARDSKPSTRNTRGRSKPVTIDIEATSSTAEPETPAGETAETAGMEPAVEIVEAGADPVDVPQEQASQEGGPVQDTLIDEKSVSEAEAEITEAALETASDSAPTDETMLEAAGGSPFDAPASETDAAPEMAEDSPATAEEDTPRQDASEQGAPQPAAPAPRRSGGGLVGGHLQHPA